jgi:hypothetical protein
VDAPIDVNANSIEVVRISATFWLLNSGAWDLAIATGTIVTNCQENAVTMRLAIRALCKFISLLGGALDKKPSCGLPMIAMNSL